MGKIIQNGNWWKAPLLVFCLSGILYFGRGIIYFDRMTIQMANHEQRLCKIELVLEKQAVRDYILMQLAEKQGIRIPKGL